VQKIKLLKSKIQLTSPACIMTNTRSPPSFTFKAKITIQALLKLIGEGQVSGIGEIDSEFVSSKT
jgi:hypothetical protein